MKNKSIILAMIAGAAGIIVLTIREKRVMKEIDEHIAQMTADTEKSYKEAEEALARLDEIHKHADEIITYHKEKMRNEGILFEEMNEKPQLRVVK